MSVYTASRGLSNKQLSDIRELEQACLEKEKLCMKLNYEMGFIPALSKYPV
jgi:hypothetical protein